MPHRDGGVREVELRPAIRADVTNWTTTWLPEILGHRADASWDWGAELTTADALGHLCLVLSWEGQTEALLSVSDDGAELSRIDRMSRLLYVERLAVAPWNDSIFLRARGGGQRPEFRGLGSLLIEAAIELAIRAGHDGRIGLHAEETAIEWYRDRLGMRPFEREQYSDGEWLYFEGDPVWAQARLREGKP